MRGHSKIHFHPSVQDFFAIKNVSLNARVSGYLDFKFNNLSPFGGFLGVFMQKGANCEVLNLNNRRLGRLKIPVILQKSLLLMGETLQKNLIFE